MVDATGCQPVGSNVPTEAAEAGAAFVHVTVSAANGVVHSRRSRRKRLRLPGAMLTRARIAVQSIEPR